MATADDNSRPQQQFDGLAYAVLTPVRDTPVIVKAFYPQDAVNKFKEMYDYPISGVYVQVARDSWS